jgi:hypothetical protein
VRVKSGKRRSPSTSRDTRQEVWRASKVQKICGESSERERLRRKRREEREGEKLVPVS